MFIVSQVILAEIHFILKQKGLATSTRLRRVFSDGNVEYDMNKELLQDLPFYIF
jgi:hypothetical protein